MVTLDVRPQEETGAETCETVDIDMDSFSMKPEDRSETSTWSYSMPSPGVRYYAFNRPRAIKTAGKAIAGKKF